MVASPPPSGRPDGYLYCESTHLTDFGGLVKVPTSSDELLDELSAIRFRTISVDDVANVLTEFDVANNPAIFSTIFIFIGLDIIMIACARWRFHRRSLAVKRTRVTTLRNRRDPVFREKKRNDELVDMLSRSREATRAYQIAKRSGLPLSVLPENLRQEAAAIMLQKIWRSRSQKLVFKTQKRGATSLQSFARMVLVSRSIRPQLARRRAELGKTVQKSSGLIRSYSDRLQWDGPGSENLELRRSGQGTPQMSSSSSSPALSIKRFVLDEAGTLREADRSPALASEVDLATAFPATSSWMTQRGNCTQAQATPSGDPVVQHSGTKKPRRIVLSVPPDSPQSPPLSPPPVPDRLLRPTASSSSRHTIREAARIERNKHAAAASLLAVSQQRRADPTEPTRPGCMTQRENRYRSITSTSQAILASNTLRRAKEAFEAAETSGIDSRATALAPDEPPSRDRVVHGTSACNRATDDDSLRQPCCDDERTLLAHAQSSFGASAQMAVGVPVKRTPVLGVRTGPQGNAVPTSGASEGDRAEIQQAATGEKVGHPKPSQGIRLQLADKQATAGTKFKGRKVTKATKAEALRFKLEMRKDDTRQLHALANQKGGLHMSRVAMARMTRSTRAFASAFWKTLQDEHTIVSAVLPGADSLTGDRLHDENIIHLFWCMVAGELCVLLVLADGAEVQLFSITTIINGAITTFTCAAFGAIIKQIFRWGNRRFVRLRDKQGALQRIASLIVVGFCRIGRRSDKALRAINPEIGALRSKKVKAAWHGHTPRMVTPTVARPRACTTGSYSISVVSRTSLGTSSMPSTDTCGGSPSTLRSLQPSVSKASLAASTSCSNSTLQTTYQSVQSGQVVRHGRKRFRKLSRRMQWARFCFAWLLSMALFLTACIIALVYGVLLTESAFNTLRLAWIAGLVFTWMVIEPSEVLGILALPYFSNMECVQKVRNKCKDYGIYG